jgi:hypothetical protein
MIQHDKCRSHGLAEPLLGVPHQQALTFQHTNVRTRGSRLGQSRAALPRIFRVIDSGSRGKAFEKSAPECGHLTLRAPRLGRSVHQPSQSVEQKHFGRLIVISIISKRTLSVKVVALIRFGRPMLRKEASSRKIVASYSFQ